MFTFEGFLESVERDLGQPLDGDVEDAVLALAGQRHLQFDAVVADGQRIARVQVAAAVEDGLQSAKDFTISMHHRFYDLSAKKQKEQRLV